MSQNFIFEMETVAIDRIVLFASAAGAENFLREIFPIFSQCIVASADGIYPKRADLRAAVFAALKNKPDLRVIIFNQSALKNIELKTERILVMDDLIMQDFKDHPAERLVRLELSAEKMAFMMESFFKQWEKMSRIGNVGFAYDNFKEYSKEKFNWKSSLLSDSLNASENN